MGIKLTNYPLQVHIRVASPPLKHPCYMGINIPTKDELIANKMSVEKLAEHLGIFSLAASRAERIIFSLWCLCICKYGCSVLATYKVLWDFKNSKTEMCYIASLTLHSVVWLLGRDTNQRFLCKDLFHLSKMSEGETQTKPYVVII